MCGTCDTADALAVVARARRVADALAAELAACPALGESWRQTLQQIAGGRGDLDESRRLVGQNREE